MSKKLLAVCTSLLMLVACGVSEQADPLEPAPVQHPDAGSPPVTTPPVTTPPVTTPPGPAPVTVSATVHADLSKTTVKGQVRFALLWVNPLLPILSVGLQSDVPATLVNGRATAQLDLSNPPPQDVITTQDNAQFALGAVVVYEDVNGNGKLDDFQVGTAPLDHILGVSLGLPTASDPKPSRSFVVWSKVDTATLKAGYQLLTGTDVSDAQTAADIQVPVRASAWNNTFACAGVNAPENVSRCTCAQKDQLNFAVTVADEPQSFVVIINNQLPKPVSVSVTGCGAPLENTQVMLDGQVLKYDADGKAFLGTKVLAGGDHSLKVAAKGYTERTATLTVPVATFKSLSPGASVSKSKPLHLAYDLPALATTTYLTLTNAAGDIVWGFEELSGSQLTSDEPMDSAELGANLAELSVSYTYYDAGGGSVNGMSTQRIPFTVTR